MTARSRRRVSVFGSTGSVGAKTVGILEELGGADTFDVVALSGGHNVELLARQARALNADIAVAAYDGGLAELRERLRGSSTIAASGRDALVESADRPVDWAMSAIVGFAGLLPGLRCLDQGCSLALANKESLVAAGRLVTAAAMKSGGKLLPVDSEHSAVFQLLAHEPMKVVETIVLTASGGPFRTSKIEDLAEVTPETAARHPTWKMGTRISIDSATMFNKALEVIEARELFGIDADAIKVVVHPQSIIHAMVQFCDGQMLAHMSSPDMRGAIEYALHWPERRMSRLARLDIMALKQLDFEEPDETKFPALRLARDVLELGGLAGAVFNGAKEAALDAFLAGRCGFMDMPRAVEVALNKLAGNGSLGGNPLDLGEILAADQLARVTVREQFGERAEPG